MTSSTAFMNLPSCTPRVIPVVKLDVFNRYLEFEARLDTQMIWDEASGANDLKSHKVVLTAEKVAVQPLMRNDAPTGRIGLHFNGGSRGDNSNDSQSSISVKPGQVVNVFQGVFQPTIRVVDRFVSRARLYRPHPINEVLREWEFVECTLVEVADVTDRKLQAVCIGGRLGSLRIGDCIPNKTVQSRAELINYLADFERDLVGLDFSNAVGGELSGQDIPPGSLSLRIAGPALSLSRTEFHSDKIAL
jgi:hypothetical protein